MRIRRRATDALQHAPVASSSLTRSPPPTHRTTAPPSETVGRCGDAEPPAREAKRSTCEDITDGHRPPSHLRNRQEEVKEENEKRREEGEDGRPELEHERPVHVVCSTWAAPKNEDEERRTEVEEEKREDPTQVKDKEESSTVPICRKSDGKGWQCKRAAQPGCSLCPYHLDKLRSYSRHSQKKKPKAAAPQSGISVAARSQSSGASQQQQQRKKRRRECVPSGRPDVSDSSYYYYSGFGPRWGKRRENRSAAGGASDQVHPHQDVGGDATGAAAGEDEAGKVEGEEYDCDGANREGKPVKSRRLSSLL